MGLYTAFFKIGGVPNLCLVINSVWFWNFYCERLKGIRKRVKFNYETAFGAQMHLKSFPCKLFLSVIWSLIFIVMSSECIRKKQHFPNPANYV